MHAYPLLCHPPGAQSQWQVKAKLDIMRHMRQKAFRRVYNQETPGLSHESGGGVGQDSGVVMDTLVQSLRLWNPKLNRSNYSSCTLSHMCPFPKLQGAQLVYLMPVGKSVLSKVQLHICCEGMHVDNKKPAKVHFSSAPMGHTPGTGHWAGKGAQKRTGLYTEEPTTRT